MTTDFAAHAEGAVRANGARPAIGAVLAPDTDVYETDDHVVVVADVPGASPEEIDVRLERRVLTLSARVNEPQPDGFRRIHAEHRAAAWERAFTLSSDVDAERIEATLKDGVLTVRLPKTETARTRRIAINRA